MDRSGQFDRVNDVLENPGPLVFAQLGPEIDIPGRLGNFEYKLRGAVHEPALVPRAAAALGEDPK